MIWIMKHPQATRDMLGYLPYLLSDHDPRSAREQLETNYAHGGGWRPFPGFTMGADGTLRYPGDPPLRLLAESTLRDEVIRFYDCAWLVVMQPDGSWEVCRVD